MSWLGRSFLSIDEFTKNDFISVFEVASDFRKNGIPSTDRNIVVAPFFFEPSTRTSLSFQMAAFRLGYKSLEFDVAHSSMKKGETILHTLQTVDVMGPDLMVVRHGFKDVSLKELSAELESPMINAGEGVSGHPTQALLDAFTILSERGKIEGERVLFLGDVEHSRVYRSNRELLRLFGAEVGVCTATQPEELSSENYFNSIEAGLAWATVCIALRTQDERHSDESKEFSNWLKSNQLNKERVRKFDSEGLLMHPGPFRVGEEISADILEDPRCRIFHQKRNGVLIRAALMSQIIEGER